jgi:aminocarboxymuconate-semialdehyde decarboxylase
MTPPVWDMHVHFVPPNVVEAAEAGRFGMRVEDEKLVVPGGAIPLGKLTDLGALLGWMNERSISGTAISVPPLLFRYDLEPVEVAEWTKLVNDGLESVISEAPDRLRILAYLPLQAPELATAEVEGAASRGHSGFSIGSSVGGKTLDDPSFEPVFQRLNDAGRFVFVHPVEAPDPRLGRYYLGNLLGNPYETSLAAACLVFSGMLSRYGNIRFCLAHAGGTAPYLIGRWQRGYETDRPGISPLSVEPREALRRLWFDSVAHSDAALTLLVEEVGADRVLLGSDYPFPMREDTPLAALEGLSEDAQEKISQSNYSIALDHFPEVAS